MFDASNLEHVDLLRPYLCAILFTEQSRKEADVQQHLNRMKSEVAVQCAQARALEARVRQLEMIGLLRQIQQVTLLREQESNLVSRKAALEAKIRSLQSELSHLRQSGSASAAATAETAEPPEQREDLSDEESG
eukprot:ANDGO_03279.mRNA.1 hypothetical protein AMSG_04004